MTDHYLIISRPSGCWEAAPKIIFDTLKSSEAHAKLQELQLKQPEFMYKLETWTERIKK